MLLLTNGGRERTLEEYGKLLGQAGLELASVKDTSTPFSILFGRNGMGKTTTLRSVMGLLRPSSGRVPWKGANIVDWTLASRCTSGHWLRA